MAVSPVANTWTRGQDLLVLQVSFGSVADDGSVTFGYGSSGPAFGPAYPAYLQNRGTGPSPLTPRGANPGPSVTLSTAAIRGTCDYLRIAGQYMLDQIIALDATTDNFTEILQSCNVSIGEIQRKTGNVLPMGYWNSVNATANQASTPYVQITAVAGNSSHGYGYILTMQREGLNTGITNFGKNTNEMTVRPADLGYPCVQYAEY